MKKHYYILLLTLLNCIAVFATTDPKDSTAVQQKTVSKTIYTDLAHLDETVKTLAGHYSNTTASSNGQFRSFPELNPYNINATINDNDPNVAEFNEEYLKQVFNTDNKTDSIIEAAKELFAEIVEHQKFIEQMTGNELVQLPVGIRKRLAGGNTTDDQGVITSNPSEQHTSITIGVIKAKIFPEYSELDLFAKLEIGPLNTVLFLGASGVKFSHTGGIYEEAKLNLLADVPVAQNAGQWLLTFKGGLDQNTGNADGQTFITIDCEGNVKEIAIAADVRIAKTVALPLKDDGTYLYPNKITPNANESPVNNPSYLGAGIRVNATSLEDLILEIDLPLFELKKLPKWGFRMENTLLDLSDKRNALTEVNFPPVYAQQQLLVPGNEVLWRGFYSEEISIMLPPEFKKKGSDERIMVGAKNLLIDNFGVSGNFYATDILDINDGEASKWQFSVDNLEVDIQVNQFVKAKFDGAIVLPISQKVVKDTVTNQTDTLDVKHGGLKYRGLISADRNYSLRVDIQEDVDFNIFKSRAKLFRDSYVKLEVRDNKFLPEANLTGIMSFNDDQDEAIDSINSSNFKKIEFEGLSFQNFKIQTAARPYLSIQYMGYKDSISLPKINGFQLGFYDISATTDHQDDRAEIAFNSYINLDKSGIKGDVKLRIVGELEDGDYLRWKYKTTEIDAVKVDVSRKSFEFKGELNFFENDTTYGKGLSGSLELYSASLKIRLGAKGIFGSVDDYRYWYVDAYGAPTNTSANSNFVIHELGGGLYHHMRKAGYDERNESMSGIHYVPDDGIRLGFKALAAFEVKKSATFTGLVALEMSFNTEANGGGVSRIGFYGAAALMSGNDVQTGDNGKKEPFGDMKGMQKKLADKEKTIPNLSSMSIDKEGITYFSKNVFPDMLTGQEKFVAQVGIDFDYENEAYWGMFDIRMNAGKIKGGGYLEFYNSKTDWYIYVGEPEVSRRIEVENIPIGPFEASVNLYFMTGTILPAPAKPDPIVIDILDLTEEELAFGRNFEDDLAQGTGFAFGATFRLGKSFDWGIVYASVQAGVGFDLMIRNFGDATCRGSEEQVGIDGWYATGQLYAYLKGDIGVQIKIFGIKKKVKILEAGLATLAQGQFPNPWYLVGYAGFKVRVLGLVTVKGRLKVVIGEECEIVGKTGLQNVAIISDILPAEGTKNVDVFEAVQVAFNAPMNEELVVEEDAGRKTYKVSLKDFIAKEGSNDLPGEIIWNNQNDLLTFESDDILPPQKDITITVKVGFEEKINGAWQLVTGTDGQVIVEEKTVTFTTGDAPTYIPYQNITYMYPVIDQKYVFPDESNIGYIKLEQGQDYLFGLDGFKDELFFIDESDVAQQVNFTYDRSQNVLNFDLPNTIKNEEQYTYRLITSKIGSGQQASTAIDSVKINDDVAMSTNTITGSASTDAIFERLTFTFNTSKHNTLGSKISAINVNNYYTLIDQGMSQVGAMGLNIDDAEPFGVNDVKGTVYTNFEPLLQLEGIQDDFYYTNDIYPLVYENYPLDGDIKVDRDETIFGVPPIRHLLLTTSYEHYATNTPEHPYLKTNFPFRWHLARIYNSDFKHLQYTLVNRYPNGASDPAFYAQYGYIINGTFPYLRREFYNVKVAYVLPNQTSGNSTVVKFKNNF